MYLDFPKSYHANVKGWPSCRPAPPPPPPPVLLGLSRPWTLAITDFGLHACDVHAHIIFCTLPLPNENLPLSFTDFLFLVSYPTSVYDGGGGGTAPGGGALSITCARVCTRAGDPLFHLSKVAP